MCDYNVSTKSGGISVDHDDINRTNFPRTGPLCREFTGPGVFPTRRPVTRSFNAFFICVWINGLVNNREAGYLRRHRGHYDVNIMISARIKMLLTGVIVNAPVIQRHINRGYRVIQNFKLYIESVRWLHSSALLTRFNSPRYDTKHCNGSCRTWIRLETHNRHPLPRPNAKAMEWLLWG